MPKRPKITSRYGPRLLGYARVSTADQSLDLQVEALKRAGVHPDDIRTEQISGVSHKRPMLDLILMQMQPGDTLTVWKLDRLGRSLPDLIHKMKTLHDCGVRFHSITEGIDTSNAMGTLLFHILGAVAQFERDLTSERTKARMAQMKAEGKRTGPDQKFTPEVKAKAREMFRQGKTVGEVRKRFKVSANTVYNYIPAHEIRELQGKDDDED